MKKNPLLEQLRRETTEEIKREVDLSFEIADRIYEILLKKNLTQRDLATLLGKSEAEISKWLRGTHNFTTKTIAKIEIALGEPIIKVNGQSRKPDILFVPVRTNESYKFKGQHCDNRESIPMNSLISSSFTENVTYNTSESLN